MCINMRMCECMCVNVCECVYLYVNTNISNQLKYEQILINIILCKVTTMILNKNYIIVLKICFYLFITNLNSFFKYIFKIYFSLNNLIIL